MAKIKISFDKGGSLTATLDNRSPKTVKAFIECLPIATTVVHTRWCGREFSLGIDTENKPPKEKITNTVSKFGVSYWKDWNSQIKNSEALSNEAISIFYGAELLRYHAGELFVNLIGRIDLNQEDLLEEIGERVWLQGKENVNIELIEE